MGMIANCMCPLHQEALLQNWMVYNLAWLLSSFGCRRISRKWIHTKLNVIGNERQLRKYLCMFPIEIFGVKPNPDVSAISESLSNIWQQNSPSSHVYLHSASHDFLISGICSVFAATVIWIVQNQLQMIGCLVAAITAIDWLMERSCLAMWNVQW